MNPRSWVEVTFRIPQSHQDLLTGQLAEAGFTGFLQEDDVLAAYLPRSRWTRSSPGKLEVLTGRFRKEFPSLDLSYTHRVIRETNWNARWERSAGIVEVTPRIVIKPRWKKLRRQDRGKLVLHIDPKMSFGTGHHETTRLCLALLERHCSAGKTILDVGCGTGVLSIAAAKLGARRVTAIDSDDWAVANTRENLKRNRVKEIRVLKGKADHLPSGRFDMILSNIDLPTNLKMLRIFMKRLLPGGMLILSGMLSKDLISLLNALRGTKAVPVELLEENEWVAVALARADAH